MAEITNSKDELLSQILELKEELRNSQDLVEWKQNRLQLAMVSVKMGGWDYFITESRLEFDDAKLALYGLSRDTFDFTLEAWLATVIDEDRDSVQKKVSNCLKNGSPYIDTYRINLPGGEIRYITTRGLFFRDVKGVVSRAMGLSWDVTEQKLREIELADTINQLNKTLEKLGNTQTHLIQSEKMVSLGILSAGIAHEINNPINFIYSGINSLNQDFEDIKPILELCIATNKSYLEQEEELSKIKDSIDLDVLLETIPQTIGDIKYGAMRTTEIVKGLRNFSKVDPNVKQITNIHEGIDSALLLLKSRIGHDIKIIKEYDTSVPEINAYSGELNQVFLNVLNNAMDVLLEETARSEEEECNCIITIKTFKKPEHIEISIGDNGPGILHENLDKVFNPFFTTRSVGDGVGLGLSISHGIIEKHGGSIEVKSEQGKGAEFIIVIPVDK